MSEHNDNRLILLAIATRYNEIKQKEKEAKILSALLTATGIIEELNWKTYDDEVESITQEAADKLNYCLDLLGWEEDDEE